MCIVAEKQKTELNEELIISYLKEIVQKIRTEEDPLELNEYRRLFRKAVPFTLRSYFAAYLLKQQFAGKQSARSGMSSRNDRSGRNSKKERNETRPARQEEPRRGKTADTRRQDGRLADSRSDARPDSRNESRQNESRQSEPRTVEPRIILAEEVSTTLFLSIGRNRRVYPRDLIGLIMQNVEIEREHIGEIRVLDNYSFVQVITEDAEKIIASLNEFEYRGRKLAVSYSRKRDEQPSGGSVLADTAENGTGLEESGMEDEAYDETAPQSDSWISETDAPDDEENNPEIQ